MLQQGAVIQGQCRVITEIRCIQIFYGFFSVIHFHGTSLENFSFTHLSYRTFYQRREMFCKPFLPGMLFGKQTGMNRFWPPRYWAGSVGVFWNNHFWKVYRAFSNVLLNFLLETYQMLWGIFMSVIEERPLTEMRCSRLNWCVWSSLWWINWQGKTKERKSEKWMRKEGLDHLNLPSLIEKVSTNETCPKNKYVSENWRTVQWLIYIRFTVQGTFCVRIGEKLTSQ